MATETLDKRKMNLIVQITLIDDEEKLRQYEEMFEQDKTDITEKQRELLKKLAKPMRKTLDIEQIKKEQGWTGVDREKFDRLIDELDIQEPLEQLIADIGK